MALSKVAAWSVLPVERQVNILNAAKDGEKAEYVLASHVEIDVMNEEFGESAKILVTQCVRWLLLLHSVVPVREVRELLEHVVPLAARHLRRAGAGSIRVTNRSPERAEKLAKEIEGDARPWEMLQDLIADADVVISSTGAREPVLTKPLMKKAMKAMKRPASACHPPPPAHAAVLGGGAGAPKHGIMWYKKTKTIGIREKFGLKRQVVSFGGVSCEKSEGDMRILAKQVVEWLDNGMGKVEAKIEAAKLVKAA